MPLRAPQVYPDNQRSFDQWTRQVQVTPDDGSVTTVTVADKAITDAKLRDSQPTSVIGRTTNTAGPPADIVAGADDRFLVRRAGALAFGTIGDTDIPATLARDTEVTAGDAAVTAAFQAADTAITTAYIAADTVVANNASAALAALHSTGTYTSAFTGTTTDPAPVLRYTITSKSVLLYVPQTSATSNATTFTITGAPAAIRPARAQTVLAIVRDNGTVSIGTASMNTGGTLTLGLGVASGAFTNSGTKGVELQTLSYSLD
jgi:hypothetical protein